MNDTPASTAEIAKPLLAWYDRHRRDLPWRSQPAARPDPYHVWLSEIMLQQTTVAAVAPYFRDFLARWPTVQDLAAADLDAVLHAWQGLGYYARARNLHACAKAVARDHGGVFPNSESALAELPGIGPYTSAAIAAIAFDRPASPVDGNIERVVARLFAVETPLPTSKPEIRRLAARLTPRQRPGDYAQAMMDLGAMVCLARKPDCAACPLRRSCRAETEGLSAELPRRSPKRARPTRRAAVFWLRDGAGRVLFRRRPEKGLLGGMMELPSTPWQEGGWSEADLLQYAPAAADWRQLGGQVEHVFTHFRLELAVFAAELNGDGPVQVPDGVWRRPEAFHELALPTVMKKLCRHGLGS